MAQGPPARNLQCGQALAADSQLAQSLARQMQSFHRMKLEKAQTRIARVARYRTVFGATVAMRVFAGAKGTSNPRRTVNSVHDAACT